jgi:hypothetical protein
VLRLLYREIREHDWKKIRRYWRYDIDQRGATKNLLFQGFVANWLEFRFWRKTRDPFLQPTHFSLLGLFNVQRVDEPCDIGLYNLWDQLHDLIGDEIMTDDHHFDNPKNFSFRAGKLRIQDYGSRITQAIITKHGANIVEKFDPQYASKDRAKQIAAREQEGH